jgi:hypothetical protein
LDGNGRSVTKAHIAVTTYHSIDENDENNKQEK